MDPVHAFLDQAGAPVAVIATTLSALTLGLIVRRFRRQELPAIRRIAGWWGLYVAFAAAFWIAGEDAPEGLHRFLGGGMDLFQAYAVLGMAGLLVFGLALPALGLQVVRITSDLLVGGAYVFITLGVLTAAGLDFGSALAASTVAAAVLTISLQTTLGNVVGGVALQLEGSVRVGDWIQLESGKQGRVAELGWRHTLLETREWDTIVVPNAALLQGQFILLGRRGGRSVARRQNVTFQVDFRHSPAEVCELVEGALAGSPIPNVSHEPAIQVLCTDLGRENRDSYAHYAVRYWVIDVATNELTDAAVRARIYAGLSRAGVQLARPSITQFHFEGGERAERAREERRRETLVAMLRSLAIFRTLTEEELDHLASGLVYCPFDAGETITRQGADAHWLYVLEEGTCEVVTEVDGVRRVVAELHAPDVFGEMGLMTGEVRSASVLAQSAVVCQRLEKTAFERVLHARPALAADLSLVLAQRRMELQEVREQIGADTRAQRMESERDRILERIKSFFRID